MATPVKIFVPRETSAVSMGADEVAAKILARAKGGSVTTSNSSATVRGA
jgi:hypothetical protein